MASCLFWLCWLSRPQSEHRITWGCLHPHFLPLLFLWSGSSGHSCRLNISQNFFLETSLKPRNVQLTVSLASTWKCLLWFQMGHVWYRLGLPPWPVPPNAAVFLENTDCLVLMTLRNVTACSSIFPLPHMPLAFALPACSSSELAQTLPISG